jgi:lipoprotein LprG
MSFHLLIHRRRSGLVLLLGLLLLAACDTNSAPPALQPGDVLSKAAPKMAALKSFHFSLSTSKVDKAPSSLYITGADGDVARPGKLQATAKALTAFGAVEVHVAALGDQQYMTDPVSQRWQKIPPSFNALALLDPGKAIADILANVKNPADDGSETLDGVASYRIKATVAPEAVRALSPEITATDPLSTTLWVGSQDFLVRQVQITGALLKNEPATVVRTLKFSQFDTPVDIQLPPGVAP